VFESDAVLVIGCPNGASDKAKRATLQSVGERLVEFDESVADGFSGGGVYAKNGDLVGLTILSGQYGRAIAVERIRAELQPVARKAGFDLPLVDRPGAPRRRYQLTLRVGGTSADPVKSTDAPDASSGVSVGLALQMPAYDWKSLRLRLELGLRFDFLETREQIVSPSGVAVQSTDVQSNTGWGQAGLDLVVWPDARLRPVVRLGGLAGVQTLDASITTDADYTLVYGALGGVGAQLTLGGLGFGVGIEYMLLRVNLPQYRFRNFAVDVTTPQLWHHATSLYAELGYTFE
jgi:hypothetical protein